MAALTHRREYFERMYAESDDPWNFEQSWYERRKYDLTLAALPRRRYRRAFEPGCSVGVLSGGLAFRCDELICMDLLPAVVERTARRLAQHRHVAVCAGSVPEEWPDGTFDLVVLSEVGYYMQPAGFDFLLQRVRDSLEPGGHLVAVHYLGETDYPITGCEVGERLLACPDLVRLARYEEAAFALEVYQRGD